MEKTRYSIPNISCGHCVMAIQKGLGELDGVSKVDGDPMLKSIVVEWGPPATREQIKNKLKEINYPSAD
jgi:copper chaperone